MLLAACETSLEPTPEPPRPTIQDSKWVDAAIGAGFPADLVPWLADPDNHGTLPSSPDLRSRYVNAFADLSGVTRYEFLVLGLGWSASVFARFHDEDLPPAPTPIPWQKQWLAHSRGGADGVVAEATTARGRAVGAELWIKCYEDIRSTEVTIGFNFADNSAFADERFEATVEASYFSYILDRDRIATAAASEDSFRDIWATWTAESNALRATAEAAGIPASDDVSDNDIRKAVAAATAEAAYTSATAEAVRAAGVRRPIATIQAAARAAEGSIDEIFISRRAAGEPGRWIKSGWKHYPSTGGYLVLEQAPAAAFIQQLSEVEEFAVLVTHDFGEDTAAVFDVRHLDAALASDTVGWDC